MLPPLPQTINTDITGNLYDNFEDDKPSHWPLHASMDLTKFLTLDTLSAPVLEFLNNLWVIGTE
jgi:hypothetical protein